MTHSRPEATDLGEQHHRAILELAEHSHSPLPIVEKIYRDELQVLEREARIMQYLPLVVGRRARDVLRGRQRAA
jgi:hypothetical protein